MYYGYLYTFVYLLFVDKYIYLCMYMHTEKLRQKIDRQRDNQRCRKNTQSFTLNVSLKMVPV